MAAKCPGTWNSGTVEQRQTPGTSKVPRGVDGSVHKSTRGHWFYGRKLKKTYQLPKTQTFWQYWASGLHCWRPPFFLERYIPILKFPLVSFPLQLFTPKHLKNRQRCPWKMWDHHTTRHHRKRLRILHHQPGVFLSMLHGTGQNYCLKICLNDVNMETVSHSCLMCIFRHSISFELYKTVSCDMNSESRNFQWFWASCRIFSYRGHRTVFLSRKNGGLQQFHGCSWKKSSCRTSGNWATELGSVEGSFTKG